MAWERKLMRTVRVRNAQKSGTLARLLASIADMGASVGSIEMLTETAQAVVRDITVYADDEEHIHHSRRKDVGLGTRSRGKAQQERVGARG